MPRRRGHDPIGREPFDHEACKRRIPQIVLDLCNEIDLALELDVEIIGLVSAVLDNGDFRNGAVEEKTRAIPDGDLNRDEAGAIVPDANCCGRQA